MTTAPPEPGFPFGPTDGNPHPSWSGSSSAHGSPHWHPPKARRRPAAVRRIRGRLAAEVRSLNGGNAIAVIRRLNPIIWGWAGYYRSVVSKEVFSAVDNYLWGRLYRWALRAHPNKSRHWVAARYFGLFNPFRNDRWVFGDRDSGIYLRQFAWTKIVRHKMVMGTASPDDPALD